MYNKNAQIERFLFCMILNNMKSKAQPKATPAESIKTSRSSPLLPGTNFWCISSLIAYKKQNKTARRQFLAHFLLYDNLIPVSSLNYVYKFGYPR